MTRAEIQEVLNACAARLEARADEFEASARYVDTNDVVASVLRAEATIIRAGCHVYPELPPAGTGTSGLPCSSLPNVS